MARELNQADWRRDRNIKDQYGRIWLVSFETGPGGQGGSQMPTGPMMPAGWSDPLGASANAPPGSLRIPMGEFGEPDRNKLLCDFTTWFAVQRAAEREWRARMNQIGQRQYKSAYDPKTAEADDLLMDLAGPKPWPPSQAIQRAMQGDKAMLGLAPLSKEDRKLLGVETAQDLGYAEEPAAAEDNPALPPAHPRTVEQRTVSTIKALTYWAFVKKMKANGVSDPAEIKAHYRVYKEEMAAETAEED